MISISLVCSLGTTIGIGKAAVRSNGRRVYGVDTATAPRNGRASQGFNGSNSSQSVKIRIREARICILFMDWFHPCNGSVRQSSVGSVWEFFLESHGPLLRPSSFGHFVIGSRWVPRQTHQRGTPVWVLGDEFGNVQSHCLVIDTSISCMCRWRK